jgi:phasin family protein
MLLCSDKVLTLIFYRSIIIFLNYLLRSSITKGSFIMFTTTPEQFATAMKPFNKLLEINTKSVVQLINLQKTFLTAICWEVATQTKALSTQTDLGKAIGDQKYYSDQLQTKVSTSAKDAYEVVTKNSEEMVHLVEDAITEVSDFTI